MMFIAAGILFLVVLFLFKKRAAKGEIHARFGIRESTHKILSTDLGNSQARMKLTRFGINGIADAVFKSLSGKAILVGEFKSRKYRAEVRLYEFYQLILYMGHIQAQYPDHTIVGCLAYADGRVKVTFDKAVYEGLVGLRDEYRQTIWKKRPVNKTPLHRRMNVRGENRSLRFTDKL